MATTPVISLWAHYGVVLPLRPIKCNTILDMGGAGRLVPLMPGAEVTNANKTSGQDACRTGYPDKSFDVVVSIATLEHVEDQFAFITESIRLARKATCHWFPYGPAAEDCERFKASIGHSHPCILPDKSCFPRGAKIATHMTVGEHLLLLAAIKPQIVSPDLFAYIAKNGRKRYGVSLLLRNAQ